MGNKWDNDKGLFIPQRPVIKHETNETLVRSSSFLNYLYDKSYNVGKTIITDVMLQLQNRKCIIILTEAYTTTVQVITCTKFHIA